MSLPLNNPLNIVEKLWGREEWIVNGDHYCGKILTLDPGFQCSLHRHAIKTETFWVVSGAVLMEIDNEILVLSAGDVAHVRPGQYHRFSAASLSPAQVIEFSTHHEDSDSERLEESRAI